MGKTGHRSVDSVCSYKRVSQEQEKVLSDILNLSATPNADGVLVLNLPTKVMKLTASENSHKLPEQKVLNFSGCSGITVSLRVFFRLIPVRLMLKVISLFALALICITEANACTTDSFASIVLLSL